MLVFHPSLTGRNAKGIPGELPGVGPVSSFMLGMINAVQECQLCCLTPTEAHLGSRSGAKAACMHEWLGPEECGVYERKMISLRVAAIHRYLCLH